MRYYFLANALMITSVVKNYSRTCTCKTEATGQLHVLAALPLDKEPLVPTEQVDARVAQDALEK
jgi:hypothetical protein